jgi:hypothetical protein
MKGNKINEELRKETQDNGGNANVKNMNKCM